MKLFIKIILFFFTAVFILILNRIGGKPMERWKFNMTSKKTDEDLPEDIRICGDCKHAIPNPKDKYAPRGILLCLVTLMPVHRSKSVNYCNSYAIKEYHDEERKETKTP